MALTLTLALILTPSPDPLTLALAPSPDPNQVRKEIEEIDRGIGSTNDLTQRQVGNSVVVVAVVRVVPV